MELIHYKRLKHITMLITLTLLGNSIHFVFAKTFEVEHASPVRSLANELRLHREWIKSDQKDGKRADFSNMNMKNISFSFDKYLMRIIFSYSNLSGASFYDTDLTYARFYHANLSKANLMASNLTGAVLIDCDLSGANLDGAILTNALLNGADLSCTYFDIRPDDLPKLEMFTAVKNLSLIKYYYTPSYLIQLRNKLKDAGLRKQERELTYAIKNRAYELAINGSPYGPTVYVNESNFIEKIEAISGKLFFGLTCKWGMAPAQPVFIMFGLMLIFSLPYYFSLSLQRKQDGIWRVWISKRIRKDIGNDLPELLTLHGINAIKYALYFSLLSAFDIGWRDFNVGGWIARVQPKEYMLQATGWVRVISGIQSLFSVYLLSLTILTYFGRPFE